MISTSSDKQLYMLLNTEEYTNYPYETKGLGENGSRKSSDKRLVETTFSVES